MVVPVSRLRLWFAAGAILMIATVAGMYFYAQWRVSKVVRNLPNKVGLDIQQTAEGFSISKSAEGRTLFTVSASKAVQFKGNGRAALHNVKIVIYGRDSSRFDRITGEDFEYDPASGNVSANGPVLIDLEANPEGMRQRDQSLPEKTSDPIHLETNGLVFNRNTGDASASGKVMFATPQASGSAIGIDYVAKTGTMRLLSSISMIVSKPSELRLNAARGEITKLPRRVMLTGVQLARERQQMQSEQATFFLRDDDTVDHIVAEGDVRTELHGRSEVHARSDRAELFLTGTRNLLTEAILSGRVEFASAGGVTSTDQDKAAQNQPAQAVAGVSTGPSSGNSAGGAEATAGRVTLRFAGQQILQSVRADEGVRLSQKQTKGGNAADPAEQDVEMTAPAMDFAVKDGHLIEDAVTSGPPQIMIAKPGTNQKTVVTAQKFTAKFTDQNRLASLHGEPDAKIVSGRIDSSGAKSGAAEPERVSTSQALNVDFRPGGGVASVAQTGGVTYVSGTQKAWAERGEYTTADEMLVLSGGPRVADSGMTTTARTIRMNRVTGDAIAEGNVKTTYSDLKAQPDGGMLAASDPIHVTSQSMTAHHSPGVAVYSGDARLWQNANVVEAPTLQFDRDRRSLLAHGGPSAGSGSATTAQPVTTVVVQSDKNGKVTPVHITSAQLNYADAERKISLDGGVVAKGPETTLRAEQMTVFLLARNQAHGEAGPVTGQGVPGQVERIVAGDKVVITQPTRRATGDRLVYTAAEEKFVLTGGPPCIFDAERGKISGDSLTFYRHDDRVLVEGRETSPAVTRTQVAR